MAEDLEVVRANIDPRTFSIRDTIRRILPRGHVIHGYSSANSTRLMMVLESRTYSDHAPMLGFGADGQAERALGRALLTYAIREQMGLEYIAETQLPESTQAPVHVGDNRSRFDNIVWGGDFCLYQEGAVVTAGSSYGGGYGMSPLEVSAADALAAIIALTDTYEFMNGSVESLPAISLE